MSTPGGPEQPEQPGQADPPGPNPYQPQQQNPYHPQGPPQQSYYGQHQQPYQQGYPQAPYGYTPPPPNHPSANTAMVLGIIALAGMVTCGGITLVLSPFAWGIGSKAVREIDANPTTYGGRSSANAGKVMGIVGTVLLILGIVALIGIIALVVATSDSSTTFETNT
jgi:hypothetical protein